MPLSHVLGTEEEIEKIIRTYSRIYYIFFGWGKYLIALLIAVVISISLIRDAHITQTQARTETLKKQENKLVEEYSKLLEFESINKEFDLHIQQGPLGYEGSQIESANNFITFRGFVLPKKISVNKNIQVQPKSYFENPAYDVKEIQLFMDNFIYINNDEAPQTPYKNQTLTLEPESLIKYFRLSCVQGILLYSGICDNIMEDFLSHFYVYDLSNNYADITTIFEALYEKENYQTRICDGLLQYVQYTNDNNQALFPLMRTCGETYKNEFNAFSEFITIQEQLANKTINSEISVNKDINVYKLISSMQMIFGDLQKRQLNQNLILSYIRYVEELLKKKGVEAFYYDVIYLFNNNYLEKNIIKNFINLKSEQNDNTQKILDGLRNLNQGNTVINIPGLETQVHNQSVLLLKDNIKNIEFTSTTGAESSLEYFTRVFSFANFTINQTTATTDATLSVQGSYRYEDTASLNGIKIPRKIDVKMIVQEENASFLVKKLETSDAKISQFVNNYVANNRQTIQDIYVLIKDNWTVIQQGVTQIDVCAKLKTIRTSQQAIKECSNTQVLISTKHPRKQENIEYTVLHNEGIITSVRASDNKVVDQLYKDFDVNTITSITMPNFIISLIEYKTNDPETRVINYGEGQNDKIYIDSMIKKYLSVAPANILEKNGNFLIEITIKDVAMLVGYTIGSDTLGPLTFRDHRDIIFNNFSLSLKDNNIDAIYNFKIEPLDYLSVLNSNLVDKYKSAQP